MSKLKLREYVDSNGNCVNLGRHLKANDAAVYNWVLEQTDWLTARSFNERVYCILHDITSPQLDVWGQPARFVNLFIGYSLKTAAKQRLMIQQQREQQREQQRAAKPKPVKRTKLERVRARTLRDNPGLYEPTAVKDIDYVECPILGIRMHVLTSKHIVNNLGMTVEEFDRLYPDVVKVAPRRLERIRHGLKQIDPATGLTKHALSVQKSQATLSAVDEHG